MRLCRWRVQRLLPSPNGGAGALAAHDGSAPDFRRTGADVRYLLTSSSVVGADNAPRSFLAGRRSNSASIKSLSGDGQTSRYGHPWQVDRLTLRIGSNGAYNASREGLIRHNPAVDIPVPRRESGGEDEDTRALTRDQLATFLRVVSPKHGPMFRFMASTGLRISEVLGLRWADLEIETRPVVRVRRRFYRGDVDDPKSDAGKRRVPLAPAVASELRKRKTQREPMPDDLVFPNEDGNPIHVENLRRRHFNPAMEEAGAGWATFHTLRHTFASLLFERRENPAQIQKWMGHASLKETLDTYTHLLPDDDVDPLDLSAELGGDGGRNAGAMQDTETDRNDGAVAEVEAALAGAIPS